MIVLKISSSLLKQWLFIIVSHNLVQEAGKPYNERNVTIPLASWIYELEKDCDKMFISMQLVDTNVWLPM